SARVTGTAHHRSARRAASNIPEAVAPQQDQDSLTNLHVRAPLRETPVYRMIASDNIRPDADPSLDAISWSEPTTPVRTVSGTLLTAARQISVTRIPHGREHDREER